MAIDIFHDKSGEKIEGDDSVWNFHLWNEIWTKRNDLPAGYDGWQALDSTPQEMSDGVFQAGPAPLKAIKSGNVYLPYDARFIFAEVNADRVYWYENENGEYEIKKIDTTHVGRMVVTKAVGSNETCYITDQYKYKEGSWEERNQTRLAVTFGTEPDLYEYSEKVDEIKMKLECDFDYICIGEPVQYSLDLSLTQLASATASVVVTGSIYSYNGKFIGRAGSHKYQVSLPNQKSVSGVFAAQDYAKYADFRSLLKLSVMYDLKDTRDMGFLEEEIPLRAPGPIIDIIPASGDARRVFKSGDKMKLNFVYTNKFKTTLTGGFFKLNAPGFSSRQHMKVEGALASGQSCTYSVDYAALRVGEVNLVVSFSSDQHKGLQSYTSITVQ
jgi:transglutaminase 1